MNASSYMYNLCKNRLRNLLYLVFNIFVVHLYKLCNTNRIKLIKPMIIKKFTFNSFQENTYIISSQDKCMIIDPGCSTSSEKKILEKDGFLSLNKGKIPAISGCDGYYIPNDYIRKEYQKLNK